MLLLVLNAAKHLYNRVCPSVSPSVTLFGERPPGSRNVFRVSELVLWSRVLGNTITFKMYVYKKAEYIVERLLVLLDAFKHLCKRVSVRRCVCHTLSQIGGRGGLEGGRVVWRVRMGVCPLGIVFYALCVRSNVIFSYHGGSRIRGMKLMNLRNTATIYANLVRSKPGRERIDFTPWTFLYAFFHTDGDPF